MPSRISLRPLLDTRADQALFVDREHETDELVRSVGRGLNTLVVAERGAGRTSFLIRAAGRLAESGATRPVLMSGEVAANGAELLALVIRRLGVSGGQAVAQSVASERRPTDGAGRLIDLIEELGQVVAGLPGPSAVLLDETDPSAAHTVFGQLRNELWQIDGVTWVLGGETGRRSAYLEPPADAFWEAEIELGRFAGPDLERILAVRALDLDPSSRNAVIDAAEGNPRKLLIAAREAALGADPDAIRTRARLTEKAHSQLGDAAARLVDYLEVNGPASASEQRLLDELRWGRGRAQQVFKQLEGAGLVTSSTESSVGAPGRPRKLFKLDQS